jgi:hypothetical protein
MRLFTKMFLAVCCSMVVATHALGQNGDTESVDKQSTQKEPKKMPEPEQFLSQCVGKWQGTVMAGDSNGRGQ